MAKKWVVAGSCVVAAGGCVGVGAIIMTSLASDGSGADAAEANKNVKQEQQGPGGGEVAPPGPNIQQPPLPQTPPEIKTQEKQELQDIEPVEETDDQADVSDPSFEETPDQVPESVGSGDNHLEEEYGGEDNDDLSDRHSDVIYEITGDYPKLQESCTRRSDCDFKNLIYFLDMENGGWEYNMIDLETAQRYVNGRHKHNRDSSFWAPAHLYGSYTWDRLVSEYNAWLQNWERKIRSSDEEKEQWKALRDRDLETLKSKFQIQFGDA